MQILAIICVILVYPSGYSSFDNSTGLNTTFEDLCRFDGKCLNCSDGGCDDMCVFYNNECCLNSSINNIKLEKRQFSCLRMFPEMYDLHLDCHGSYDGVYGVYMVVKCSNLWTDELIKSKCENMTDSDLLSRIPVYDYSLNIVTYRNMYCAFCNWLPFNRLRFWKFDILCNYADTYNVSKYDDAFDADVCFIRYVNRKHKMCALNIIESCYSDMSKASSTLRNKCENGLSQNVYIWRQERMFTVYKNEYCAQCNGEIGQLQCWAYQAFTCWPKALPRYTSVRTMINLNMYDENNINSEQILHSDCGEGVLYSPFSNSCLNITCLPILNTCISGKCHLVGLTDSDYEIRNLSVLYLSVLEEYFHEDRYFMIEQNMHVCLNDNQYFEFEISRQTTTNADGTTVYSQSTSERSFTVSKCNKTSDSYFGKILLTCYISFIAVFFMN
jgi:hypothetical protein